jgi:hypothetical protein
MEILISVYSPGKVTAAKHNARDENHDDSTKNLLGKNAKKKGFIVFIVLKMRKVLSSEPLQQLFYQN